VEIEIAGYNVMSELLQMYIPTVLKSNRGTYEKKVLRLMPNQYKIDNTQSSYEKIMLVIDHIAGMTDGYATELYRKVKGIEISQH
jgi:dGTPase